MPANTAGRRGRPRGVQSFLAADLYMNRADARIFGLRKAISVAPTCGTRARDRSRPRAVERVARLQPLFVSARRIRSEKHRRPTPSSVVTATHERAAHAVFSAPF